MWTFVGVVVSAWDMRSEAPAVVLFLCSRSILHVGYPVIDLPSCPTGVVMLLVTKIYWNLTSIFL